MDLQIRQGEITDAEAIHELNAREMGYHYPKDKTEEKLRQVLRSSRDRIFVALADHRVVGYVHANDYDVIYAPHMKKTDSRICLCQDRQIKQVMNEIEKSESPINQKEMIK